MSTKFHKWCKDFSLLISAEITISTITSYYLTTYLSTLYDFPMPEIAGLWGAISAVFIISPKREDVIHMAWMRFLGTIAGSLVPLVCIHIFGGYYSYTFALSLCLTVIVVSACRIRDAYKVACITTLVVLIVGAMDQEHIKPWLNAVSRLGQSTVGILVALIIDGIFYPIRQRFDLF